VTKQQGRAAAWLADLMAARGRRVLAWLAAVLAAWTLDITLAVRDVTPPEYHGLSDCGTACITVLTGVWLLFAHYWDKYMAAEKARRDEEDQRADRLYQRATTQAIIELHGDRCVLSEPPAERLRAI
jgi:hypothetical protein